MHTQTHAVHTTSIHTNIYACINALTHAIHTTSTYTQTHARTHKHTYLQ